MPRLSAERKFLEISYDGKKDIFVSFEDMSSIAKMYLSEDAFDAMDATDQIHKKTDADWLSVIDGRFIDKGVAVNRIVYEGWSLVDTYSVEAVGLQKKIDITRADPKFLDIKAAVEKIMLLEGWRIDRNQNNSVYFVKSKSADDHRKVRFSNHKLNAGQTGGASLSVCFERGQTVDEITSYLTR